MKGKPKILGIICAECGAALDDTNKPPVLAKSGDLACCECGAALEVVVLKQHKVLSIRTVYE